VLGTGYQPLQNTESGLCSQQLSACLSMTVSVTYTLRPQDLP
jgi:hypothetical protein